MTSQHDLHIALLRPPVLHILRAAGFHAAKPAALDSLVDMASRYLILIASKSAEAAYLHHNGQLPTTSDMRASLQYVGLLRPEHGPMEEQLSRDDDMRGMEGFIAWIKGPTNKEVRRIAGLARGEIDLLGLEEGSEREDFLAGELPRVHQAFVELAHRCCAQR